MARLQYFSSLVRREFDKAVYIESSDGLGNQLFQYAAGFALARRLGVCAKLCWIPRQKSHVERTLKLPVLVPGVQLASMKEWHSLRATRPEESVYRRLQAMGWNGPPYPPYRHPFARHYFERQRFGLDQRFFHLKAPVMIHGSWQNHNYFEECGSALRDTIRLHFDPSDPAYDAADMLKQPESVAVHVRLTDYVTGPHRNLFAHTDRFSYFRQAMQIVSRRLSNPRFFVFSDDPAGCTHGTRRLSGQDYSLAGRFSDVDDFQLLAAASHVIIPNSTFGWWAAWLRPQAGKIVVAPEPWVNDRQRDLTNANWQADEHMRDSENTSGMYPDGWMTVPL